MYTSGRAVTPSRHWYKPRTTTDERCATDVQRATSVAVQSLPVAPVLFVLRRGRGLGRGGSGGAVLTWSVCNYMYVYTYMYVYVRSADLHLCMHMYGVQTYVYVRSAHLRAHCRLGADP